MMVFKLPCPAWPLPGSSLKMSTGHFLNAPPPLVANEGDVRVIHGFIPGSPVV